MPEPGGLGVHATIGWDSTTSSAVKFGPNVEWVSSQINSPDDISYQPDSTQADKFCAEIAKYWPGIQNTECTLTADYVGIRPKLAHPHLGTVPPQDFLIAGPKDHGVQGLVHLLGMESPGLTSSMAVAQYVCDVLLKQ